MTIYGAKRLKYFQKTILIVKLAQVILCNQFDLLIVYRAFDYVATCDVHINGVEEKNVVFVVSVRKSYASTENSISCLNA